MKYLNNILDISTEYCGYGEKDCINIYEGSLSYNIKNMKKDLN